MKIFAFADEADTMLAGQIAAMTRNGLNGLEIRSVDEGNISDVTLERAREIRARMDDAGLLTWSIGSRLGKVNIDEDNQVSQLEELRHLMDVAHILGTENIRMFSFWMPRDRDPALYRGAVLDRLGQFLELAKGSGIDLCHENEKGIYGNIASRCLDLHQTLPELRGVFDPANYVQCHQDTLEAWQMLHPYIKYMHIKDALPTGSVVPAGAGMGNVKQILDAYRAQGGQCVTVEPHLAVFAGLSDLEREGQTSQVGGYAYPSSNAAFDAACSALKKLL